MIEEKEEINTEFIDELIEEAEKDLSVAGETVTDSAESEKFAVNSQDKAAWVLRKLNEIDEQITQNNEFKAKEIERINKWCEKENAPLENSRDYLEHLLYDYAEQVGKVSTPWGKVKTRTARKYKWDDAKCIEWAKTNNADFIKEKVTQSIDKSALKKSCTVTDDGILVDANGQPIEGVTAPYETTYSIELIK